MALSKSAKVKVEIEKAREKLAEQQARVKELENKHTELENIEIVEIVRGMSISLTDLPAFLHTAKNGAATSGQLGPKLNPFTASLESESMDKEDEVE